MYAYTYTHKKRKNNIGDGKGLVRLMLNIIFTAHKYIDIIKLIYICPHYKVENKDKKKGCLNEYFKNDEARS